ncbi:MAG: hypothetical protein CMN72_09400 [Sphingomonas sp.]|nr:hypothetical protein [Sphingomonas sp.]
MLRIALTALLAPLLVPLPAQAAPQDPMTMPIEKLEDIAPDQHPSAYFILARRAFEAGKKDAAVRWLYVGQLRWRVYLKANPDLPPDGDPALFASMMETIGRPINEWAGGNVGQWTQSLQAALDWDAEHPNGFTPKSEHKAVYASVRSGLSDFIATLREQRDSIARSRAENGLTNRAD